MGIGETVIDLEIENEGATFTESALSFASTQQSAILDKFQAVMLVIFITFLHVPISNLFTSVSLS